MLNNDSGFVDEAGIARPRVQRTPFHHLTGSNIGSTHSYNQRVILETVRRYGPLSRAEISEHTMLTTQTVSNIVDKLLGRGVLALGERREGRRGQPAVEIGLNPTGGYGVGLHLERDHYTGVLLDLSGNCLQTIRCDGPFADAETTLGTMAQTVRTLTQAASVRIEDLWGVGVALPGPLDLLRESPTAPPNFPGWDGVLLRQKLMTLLDTTIFLDTDATAAAVGERWFGRGKELHNYFYVYLGMGLGGGMILDGEPYRGAFNNAAMFGHLPVAQDGRRCGCGGKGCLELSVSLASLYETLRGSGTSLSTPAEAAALFADENPRLLGWLEEAAQRLVPALIAVENLLSPEAILFGGLLPLPLIAWLLRRLEELLPSAQTQVLPRHPILLAASAEGDAAALGAATLPLFAAFTPGREVFCK